MYCPACHADYPEDWKTCPKDSTALLKSAQIGKYTIEGLLGVGGMGAVYRAKNPDTGAAVAIKVMNKEVAAAPEARERFKREAGVVSRLDTAHVCKVYDFGADADGTMFLVMELMKGHTLREEIVPGPGYMDLARVQMVMNGALKGLAAAHLGGIVHRDLKPENVFVADTFDGEVPKLLDFGIARVSSGDNNLTRTGTMMGTASYMAPEQVAGETSRMGPWTDVYAMGAILYEMLAGAPAFGGATLSEVLTRVIKSESVPLSTVRAGLSDGVYALIDRCLSSEVATRPQDATAMRNDLVAAGLVAGTTTVPPPSKTNVELPKAAVAETIGVDSVVPITPSVPVAAPAWTPPAVPATTPTAPSPLHLANKRSMLPIAGIGVVLSVGVVILLIAAGGKAKDEPTRSSPADAQIALTDAEIKLVVDAAPVATPPPASAECPAGMVHVPAGTFVMGSVAKGSMGEEHPEHSVTLSGYCIDKTEVTLSAYWKCQQAGKCIPPSPSVNIPPSSHRVPLTPAQQKEGSERCSVNHPDPGVPANCVDWQQSKDYCEWASKRLPTEAEWEYAARGNDHRTYPWGEAKPDEHVHGSMYASSIRAVGLFPANVSPFGVLDLAGNVAEWTADFEGPYASRAQTDPTGPASGDRRVIRGGALGHDGIDLDARSALRRFAEPATRDYDLGFRCARGDSETKSAAKPNVPAVPPRSDKMADRIALPWFATIEQDGGATKTRFQLKMSASGDELRGSLTSVLTYAEKSYTRIAPVTGRMHRDADYIDFGSVNASRADPLPNGGGWCDVVHSKMKFSNDPKRGVYALRGRWDDLAGPGCEGVTFDVTFVAKALIQAAPSTP